MWGWLFYVAAAAVLSVASGAGAGAARLVCYVERGSASDFSECTHLVYTGIARGDKLDSILKEYRKNNPRLKIVLRVADTDKDLRTLLKSKYVQGLEIYDAHKTLNKTKVSETVEAARSAVKTSSGPLLLALPAHPELLAKYYELRELVKKIDLMMVQTHALGLMKKMTYHPSRLSGVWDMMNTDSVVDLVIGLGVPAYKIVVSLPATARQFTLQNETLSTPGSPTTDDEPREIDQTELCRQLRKGRWTLERDQDLSAPYAFKNKTWISFEDSSSVDVKGKYARVRGLAGLALYRADRDVETPCGPALKLSLAKVLNQQSRAPRAAVLRSLEHDILSAPGHARALEALQVSPYRITQIVDSDGVIHSIREDTRTEFACSRQGYFVHPRSCARFYRCVKFDQLSPEFTVFEFDCPAGLAFDSRYEVCVWPGSLPHTQACPGSSEIAPVPKSRFTCPEHEGYYADPENCRWFFACLNHGLASLTAYEFRCPLGLGFDAEKLKCDWPWLVPACGNIARYEAEAHGFSGAILTGAAGYQGQTADDVNVAAHQSLVSGAALNNLVGIQGGFLTKDDALDSNFITSQEFANGATRGQQAFEIGHGSTGDEQAFGISRNKGQVVYSGLAHSQFGTIENGAGTGQFDNGLAYHAANVDANSHVGIIQPTNYNSEGRKYSSGSIILDDYRLPTKDEINKHAAQQGSIIKTSITGDYTKGNNGISYSAISSGQGQKTIKYQKVNYNDDNSGAYVHDPSGDYAEPYIHQDSPAEPYSHDRSPYKHTVDYYDTGKYTGSSRYEGKYTGSGQSKYEGKYVVDNSGQYVHDNSGSYVETSSIGNGYSGSYSGSRYKGGYSGSNGYGVDHSGSAGYNSYYLGSNGYSGDYSDISGYKTDYSGAYNADNSGAYKHDDSGKYTAGVYREEGHIGGGKATNAVNFQQYHGYSEANVGNYINDAKAYTGSSHTLTAGAINVGLVGKTTLVDADYNNQLNYDGSNAQSYSHSSQTIHPSHVTYISQPAVSISHSGTNGNNQDGYSYVTTPTSSGIPTTATPFAVTTAIPVTTYKTAFVPEAPTTSIKQVFGVSHPAVTYTQPTVVAVKQITPKVQITDHNQGVNYQYESKDYSINYSTGNKKTESGYNYPKPNIKFEDGVTYTTAAPAISVSTYRPQGFSHNEQTLHNVESGYQYSTPTPISEKPFKKIVAYTTGPPVTTYSGPPVTIYSQPTVAAYTPQSYSHQTIHKVESSNSYTPPVKTTAINSGYDYQKSGIVFEEPKDFQYTTGQPALAVQSVVSTSQPQVFSHQTFHKVDASRVNTYSGESSGYNYEQPAVQFEEAQKVYSTPAPIVTSTYRPQAYSHQTIHKVETQKIVPVLSTPKVEYSYQSTPVTVYENPIFKYTQRVTPAIYERPKYKSQAYSHQTIHNVENSEANKPVNIESDYKYTKSVAFEQPKIVQYTTDKPYTTAQPVISTYASQGFSQQTLHKVDTSQIKTYSKKDNTNIYSDDSQGYEYAKPSVKFVETPKTVYEYSTAAPGVSSTYKPHSYRHQTIHKVETQNYNIPVSTASLPQADVSYQKTTYENPFIQFTKKVTPVTYVQPTASVYTQTFNPIVQQHQVNHVVSQPIQYEHNAQLTQEGYSYSQPEIQRNIETNNAKGYSDASAVSHQVFHQSNINSNFDSGKDVVFVSTTPSTLVYENHYYDSPKVEVYKDSEYIPQKNDFKSYSVLSTATPVVHQSSVIHENQEYVTPKTNYKTYTVSTPSVPVVQQAYIHQTQDNYDYKPIENYQQFDTIQNTVPISFSTYHANQPQKVESIHFSYPSSTATTKFQQVEYQSPEIQVVNKAEEYLPPVVSTATPIVSSTYRPRTYSTVSTTREYLPSAEPKYQEYPSTTARTIVKSTTPVFRTESSTAYKAEEYLPPAEDSNSKIVNYESYGYKDATASSKINYNRQHEYSVRYDTAPVAPVHRQQNIVVETAKSHLLGYGTVGPDAGLVSSATYTTAAPIVSSTYRQRVKSTSRPAYRYQSTTEYKAPEYLPPSEDTETQVNFENSFGYKNADVLTSNIQHNPYREPVVVSTTVPVQRKQNIVIETAKSHQLGFGTVGPDAGIVSSPVTYTTAAPVIVSNSESYSLSPKIVSSTITPIKQGLFEVTPSSIPLRRIKPKVAVVTKINDFNPFLVRKLGAVCSCQSPVLVLKGKKPVQPPQDLGDFNDYDDSNREDITDSDYNQKSSRIQTVGVKTYNTATPIVTSTFNPIIVPDDSYYQDYQEQNYELAVTPKHNEVYSGAYVSSTPIAVPSTERSARIRQRIKSVTVAPTYKTVLLNQEVTPTVTIQESGPASTVDSQAFDRYGPGGWRSRDETLQGSVDCQRAGLFRHPKQCNKFYACRWDCTKQRFTLHVFNCPIQLSFDPSIGACNWPSQGPACQGDTLLTNVI